jgi:hypothetical protein
MVFTCLYLASKIEEKHFYFEKKNEQGNVIEKLEDIHAFVRVINLYDICNVKLLQQQEVFLVKALKFQLVTYTQFQLIDYLCDLIFSHIPGLNLDLLKKSMSDEILKFFMRKEQLIILYSPSEMALASLDICLSH